MKQVSTLILVTIIALKSFYPLVMYSYYYANQGFFVMLCENKAKPEMKCKGRCYLKKQIAETGKKESGEMANLQGNETFVFLQATEDFRFLLQPVIQNEYSLYMGDDYSFHYNNELIHPPAMWIHL